MISLSQLSALGIGTGRVASLGSRISVTTFTRMLKLAGAAGVNVIDTADTYGSGDAERMIRKATAASGYSFFIITKAGFPHVALPARLSPLNQIGKKLLQKISPAKNFTASYLVRKAQASCRRLGQEQLDAFLLHEPGMDELRATDCWEGLLRIREQGLARFTGVSTSDPAVVEQGLRFNAIQLIQTPYSVNDDNRILSIAATQQIPVLANQIFSNRNSILAAYESQFGPVETVLSQRNITAHQLIISTVLRDPKVTTVLLGTNNPGHLQQNLMALDPEKMAGLKYAQQP